MFTRLIAAVLFGAASPALAQSMPMNLPGMAMPQHPKAKPAKNSTKTKAHSGKVSLGAVRDFRIADHLSVGAGGLFALNFAPAPLAPLDGGSNPTGLMGFLRLKLN